MAIYVDYAWFALNHDKDVCRQMIGGVKSLVSPDALAAEVQTIKIMSQIFLGWKDSIDDIKACALSECFSALKSPEQRDLLVMAVIMALCTTENIKQRLEVLLTAHSDDIVVEEKIKHVLQALYDDNIEKIKSSETLDLAYHNNLSQLNGIDLLSDSMFKKQMHSMKKGSAVPSLKQKI